MSSTNLIVDDILNVNDKVIFDDSIESIEVHPYNPYNDSFKNNDEVRISINRQDLIVLPHQSCLLIEGTIGSNCAFVNNAMAFLFQDVRYELNGIEIDRTKNCGITTTMKGLVSYGKESDHALEGMGWNMGTIKEITDGDFSFTVPLSHLLGFAEDYRKVVMNAKHELILNRSNSNVNCGTVKDVAKEIDVNITRIVWRVPIVKVSDREKLRLMSFVENDIPLPISFRSWGLFEYPMLPTGAQKHVWPIKTSSQLEKPRYIIIALQTARKNEKNKDMSQFDHCNLQNCKVYLNSQCYPYDSFALDFEKGSYALAYDAFANFQRSYYGKEVVSPQLNVSHFKTKAPIFVIDTSHQLDSFNSGAVDIRVEMEFKKSIPNNTTAYCLVINDSLFEYSALTGRVTKTN